MKNAKKMFWPTAILLVIISSTACGKSVEKVYVGNTHVSNIPKNSIYSVAQFDVQNVEATLVLRNETDGEFTLRSKEVLRLGDCEYPIKYYTDRDTKKGRVAQCSRKNNAGAPEFRNIDSGTIANNGDEITIDIKIDDFYYTFKGKEKK